MPMWSWDRSSSDSAPSATVALASDFSEGSRSTDDAPPSRCCAAIKSSATSSSRAAASLSAAPVSRSWVAVGSRSPAGTLTEALPFFSSLPLDSSPPCLLPLPPSAGASAAETVAVPSASDASDAAAAAADASTQPSPLVSLAASPPPSMSLDSLPLFVVSLTASLLSMDNTAMAAFCKTCLYFSEACAIAFSFFAWAASTASSSFSRSLRAISLRRKACSRPSCCDSRWSPALLGVSLERKKLSLRNLPIPGNPSEDLSFSTAFVKRSVLQANCASFL
mmetsp:Transcript_95940/g.311140  ORF Transcript_95940/g.311140 Transcript_95940/m.311140 type:complete len:279 (+) Transcript_95940:246-1082(+)